MSTPPEIVIRAEQPYVAIRGQVSMAEPGAFGGRLGEAFAWLQARGLAPAVPPFLKYDVIDMMRRDMSRDGAVERWCSRLEIYPTDPGQEPDMDKWVTELAFRLAV